MTLFAGKDPSKPVKAVSRSRRAVVVSTREIQIGKKLYLIKKFRDGTTTLQRSFCRGLKANNKSEAVDPSTSKPDALFNDQPPQEVKPETDEKTKVYYHAIGKLEFLLMNYQLGLRSMLRFLNKQEKLKTYKNIEVHETEFGELQFRVANFGGATTIERILKVNPETDEKTKVYYHGIGKLEFLLLNYRRGLRSMLKFLEKQAKLKTYENIEVREIEFGKQHLRVENFGGATTIERILKVKNDV